MRTLHRLWPYIKRYRGQILTGMLCLLFVDIVQLYFPLLMAKAVDALKIKDLHVVYISLAWMVGLAILIAGIRYFWRSLLLGASRKIERDLRDDFFYKLLRVPQPFLDNSRSGDLLSLSTNDISVIRQFLGLGMMSMCDSVVMISFSVFLMLTLSVKLTLLVAIPMPLVTLAMIKLGKSLHNAHEQTQNQFGDLSARLQEDLYGIRLLRGYGQEENRHKRFVSEAADYMKKNMSVIKLQGFFYPLLKFLTGLAAVAVLWFGGREVARGSLSLGQFVAFIQYIAMLSWPLMALGWIINLVQRARASMDRLNGVFDAAEEQSREDASQPRHAPANAVFGSLEIRDLSQEVGDRETGRAAGVGDADQDISFSLKGIRLAIRRGEWVGLVGKTASGKSSLVTRILRIYEPPHGTIFMDGVDVTALDLQILRDRLSYVPQEGFLFSQTLLSNFRLGSRSTPDETVTDITEIVQMKEEILGFPDGMKTRVGERGITLSGGQRQRVALGRALLKDADFYIFDDPFSGVDLATEERIFERMRRRLDGRGVLLISHRAQSLARLDRIIFIDDGRIIEEGTHARLMANGGMYARFMEAQEMATKLTAVGSAALRPQVPASGTPAGG